MNDDEKNDEQIFLLGSPLGLVGEYANTEEDPEASRRRYVLTRARAILDRLEQERAEQESAKHEEEVFDLDAYLRQFPKPLYPRFKR